jgi:NAD(P)-dependent dehydrogenase (short-subunit alcohol dehydrogenase family)
MSSVESLWSLRGQTAIITGAGRGIGRSVASLFAAAGARIVLADVNRESVTEAAAALTAGGTTAEVAAAEAMVVDISDEQSVRSLYAASFAKFGAVDILIHCAAIFPKYDLLEITVDQWDAVHAVNTRGTMLVMREAIKQMRASGRGGAIVNISSVSGEREVVFHNAAYGASKAATTNLTRVAALEYGADKIRVNAVLPGGTATEGAKQASESMKARGLEMKGPMVQPGRVPLGAMGSAADVAAACLFLASPGARFITGQCLAVDGGFLVS